jgi:hypothetical protein
MQLGALMPFHDTGGDLDTVREYAQGLEAAGCDFLEAPDHVLGANATSRPGWDPDRDTPRDLLHEPFVLLSYVSGGAPKLAYLTGPAPSQVTSMGSGAQGELPFDEGSLSEVCTPAIASCNTKPSSGRQEGRRGVSVSRRGPGAGVAAGH